MATLQQINKRAKQIRDKSPRMKWNNAQKQAAAELKKSAPKKKGKRKVGAAVKAPRKVEKTVTTKTTVGANKKALMAGLERDLGKAMVNAIGATKKPERVKYQKEVAALRVKVRIASKL